MQRFYDDAKEWCRTRGKYLRMTGLTKDLLGLDTMADYPVGQLGKGLIRVFGVHLGSTHLLPAFLKYTTHTHIHTHTHTHTHAHTHTDRHTFGFIRVPLYTSEEMVQRS